MEKFKTKNGCKTHAFYSRLTIVKIVSARKSYSLFFQPAYSVVLCVTAVSYTHLDVYKRQVKRSLKGESGRVF